MNRSTIDVQNLRHAPLLMREFGSSSRRVIENARVKGLKLARKFSLAYPSGPEPRGNAEAFRRFILSHSSSSDPGRLNTSS